MSPVVGELDKRQVASSDRVVQDPATGVLRQIVAGQPVPPDLINAEDGEQSVVDEEFEGPYEAPDEPKAEQATQEHTPPKPPGRPKAGA